VPCQCQFTRLLVRCSAGGQGRAASDWPRATRSSLEARLQESLAAVRESLPATDRPPEARVLGLSTDEWLAGARGFATLAKQVPGAPHREGGGRRGARAGPRDPGPGQPRAGGAATWACACWRWRGSWWTPTPTRGCCDSGKICHRCVRPCCSHSDESSVIGSVLHSS
jgi:hypothetical protein